MTAAHCYMLFSNLFQTFEGWSLGEHGEWAKYSNYDVATRVPLMIYSPYLAYSRRLTSRYGKAANRI